ncbi:hypothetical protein ACHAXS_013066 [Conticribra weissflogii]
MSVRELTGRRRLAFLYLAREPYEQRVSAASMTPSRYLMPRTEVPVVMGRVVTALPGADRALVGGARVALPPGWRERDMDTVLFVEYNGKKFGALRQASTLTTGSKKGAFGRIWGTNIPSNSSDHVSGLIKNR